MKLLIDCDQVFDRLTRAPFPADAPEDGAIESHLATCHECRQLAEALRPAVDLLHEAYPSVPEERLPSYHGASRRISQPASHGSWQLLAAALLGLAVGALALGRLTNGQATGERSHPTPVTAAGGLAHLASLNLQEVCLPSSFALASGGERLRCCTQCHAASGTLTKGIDVARLQLACVACHEPASSR